VCETLPYSYQSEVVPLFYWMASKKSTNILEKSTERLNYFFTPLCIFDNICILTNQWLSFSFLPGVLRQHLLIS